MLGDAAQQAGSLVEPDRLRFDFSWDGPVSFDQLQEVERLVNAEIVRNRPLDKTVMPIDDARALGAMALFGEKYGDEVRVVTVGDGEFSRELCGGCHVERTGDIGLCTITGERGVAAGVRRIEAVTGRGAVELVQERTRLANDLAGRYQTSFEQLPDLLDKRERQLSELENEVKTLKHKLASGDAGVEEIREEVDGCDGARPTGARDEPRRTPQPRRHHALRSSVRAWSCWGWSPAARRPCSPPSPMMSPIGSRPAISSASSPPWLVVVAAANPNLAQAGGPDADKLDEALAKVPEQVRALIGS